MGISNLIPLHELHELVSSGDIIVAPGEPGVHARDVIVKPAYWFVGLDWPPLVNRWTPTSP